MIQELILYRSLMSDPLINKYNELINLSSSEKIKKKNFKKKYFGLSSELINHSNDYIFSIKDYLAMKILESDNRYTFMSQTDSQSNELENIARHDLMILKKLFTYDLKALAKIADDKNVFLNYSDHNQKMVHEMTEVFETSNDMSLVGGIRDLYKKYGSGVFAFNKAFKLNGDNAIEGIRHFNPQTFETVFGYEHNKEKLITNIDSFTNGRGYHHVLLVGDNGTGKSTSVRALIPLFKDKGLKLIEIKKHQIKKIPMLFESVLNRQGKFIFFLDDLTFEIEESDYKYLKSIIEGSADIIPDNVCFCVTSNRRHIIKEVRDDRESQIHIADAINENASLSDRFGLYLHYNEPSQMEFVRMVNLYREHLNIDFTIDQLKPLALQYSRQMGGRSGRVAKQFITNIQSGLMVPE